MKEGSPSQPKPPSSCPGPTTVEASAELSSSSEVLENLVSSGALKVTRIPPNAPVERETSPNMSKDSSRESLHPDDFPDNSQSEQ